MFWMRGWRWFFAAMVVQKEREITAEICRRDFTAVSPQRDVRGHCIPQALHHAQGCMEVSWNRATPSHHPILMGFSTINHPAIGYLHLWKAPYMYYPFVMRAFLLIVQNVVLHNQEKWVSQCRRVPTWRWHIDTPLDYTWKSWKCGFCWLCGRETCGISTSPSHQEPWRAVQIGRNPNGQPWPTHRFGHVVES